MEVARFIRQIFGTAPFSALVGEETKPSLATVPTDATEAEWFEWIFT